jgi:hypothetical protein
MSLMAGFRSLARRTGIDIGAKSFSDGVTTYVNLDNKRVRRDLAKHSSIGQLLATGDTFYQGDDGVIDWGGKVTVRATGLVVDSSAVVATRANGTVVNHAADTATIGAADATNPRIDIIALDTTTPNVVVVAGTATAGANLVNRRGIADLAANRTALAYVLVPATATDLVQTNVLDVRP